MKSFLIKNENNMQVEVLDWGARIAAIRVPTKSETLANVILGYKQDDDYLTDAYNMGSTVGRYANRIAPAHVELLNETMTLTQNEGNTGNHIHGGFIGFDKKEWALVAQTSNSVTLSLKSKDGEEGYAGNLDITTTYTVTDENELQIHYWAKTDKPTVVNITNHAYFNLADGQENIDTHLITVHADTYSPFDEYHVPKAPYIQSVSDTIYDLRHAKAVKEVKKPICNMNYFVNTEGTIKEIATIEEINSGRQLSIASDYPAMQLYFAEFLSEPFHSFQGLCCEPHYAPNSPNIKSYQSATLLPTEEYNHKICYSFTNF